MFENFGKRFAVCAGLLVLVSLFGSLLIAFIHNMPKDSSAWASWVQAWGSILAIFVAIAVAYLQHDAARSAQGKKDLDAQVSYVRACYVATDEAARTLEYIARQLDAHLGQRYRLRAERIEDLQRSFTAIAGRELPAYLLQGVLSVQRELSYTLMALKQLDSAHEVTSKRVAGARRRAAIVARERGRLAARNTVYSWVHDKTILEEGLEDADFAEMDSRN